MKIIVIVRGAGEIDVMRSVREVGDGANIILGLAVDMTGGVVRCRDEVIVAAKAEVNVMTRGVLRGDARSDVFARVHLERSAAKSRAYASFDHLVLGDRVTVQALPELIVDTDDVICGHRASMVRPAQDALFYLCSRGISQGDAEGLLADGFLCPMFERIGVVV